MHSLRPLKVIVRGKSRNLEPNHCVRFEGKVVNSEKQENWF